ncbi:MAG: DUF2796 domain-containing protein [Gemmatimonadota bacterium]|nr:DUF2796 domain-containing protein [Gemmatimonadota bacterium]
MSSSDRFRRPEAMLLFPMVIVTTFGLAGCSTGNEQASGPEVEGAPVGTLGAHEHGVVRMGLAVDGQRISLNLEIPAATVFGFEHDPETEEEIALVSEAMELLRTRVGEVIAVSPELACELEDVEVVSSPEVDEGHSHSEDEDAHSDDEGHSHSEDEDAHSEVGVAASWFCGQSVEGTNANLRLGSLWPDAELVDLTVITSMGQAAGRVAADASFSF